MSHETFDLIDRLRHAQGRATMATLVRTVGTTPRKEGTKMFVGEAGDIFGSVTIGGCVDARVLEHSGTSSAELLNLQLGDEEAWEIGLTCGGAVDVFLEPVTDDVMRSYEAARREWDAGRAVALATVISGEQTGSRMLIHADGTALGNAPAGIAEMLSRDVPPLLRSASGSRTIAHDGADIYIEVLRPPARLLIFGASAVAIPLVAFTKILGFQTTIVDGRPRFATRLRFPDAGEIRIGIVSEIAETMQFGPATPVVLVAHDYKIDLPVLKKALASDVPYIGLLGSRRRGATILQMLRDDGAVEEQLARIHVPIGLDLGGDTAAEIALSIVSEVVAVMHGRNGGLLSKRS
ncbi:MAG TPA: XdhC/CoxI family protein [Thermoanaerobaculia bacterium]|jgi:xanthine dehydrogenase accessory factor|nr:XdhC/CoxI family protein [Thermoanaerobaculia bacterium]